ncbi:MAG: ATP-binding protein [Candidatus Obscuribacterales bacterium]|nr:ATP-binding protein [Candidatus Obscuribacterales bacterium]
MRAFASGLPSALMNDTAIAEVDFVNGHATFDQRVQRLFEHSKTSIYKKVDKLFAILLFSEWIACIITALVWSPRTWIGATSQTHIHLYAAIFLGGAIFTLPAILAFFQPGKTLTRHVIAIGQMLMSSLLIDVSGGRIETHFHIFGSLAFLAFYFDWRVLITASLVVTIDHFVRGFYFPLSIFGTTTVQPFRWIEHAAWVIFQDVFLIYGCVAITSELKHRSARVVEIETSREKVEREVQLRTRELRDSEKKLSAQHAVASSLNNSASVEDAAPTILKVINQVLARDVVYSAFWVTDRTSKEIVCVTKFSPMDFPDTCSKKLAQLVFSRSRAIEMDAAKINDLCSGDSFVGCSEPLSAYGFPLMVDGIVMGVCQFFYSSKDVIDTETSSLLQSMGLQIGQFILHKYAEQENQRLAHIVRSTVDSIIGMDKDGKITNWNRGAARLYGWSSKEAIGKPYSILVGNDQAAEVKHQFEAVQKDGQLENQEMMHKRRNGNEICVSQSWTVINDRTGKMSEISVIGRDISEKKEAEKRVSEFYSIVSHELRSPLTSIRASLGLLEAGKGGTLTPRATQLVKIGREEADRLVRLINDILDLRKIEAGMLELKFEKLAVSELIETGITSLKSMASTSHVEFVNTSTSKEFVYGDRDRMTQVLVNLLSNAVKFSPEDGIVTVSSEPAGTKIRFCITDKGAGIPEDQISKLFHSFQQVDSSDARAKGGTGLGLAISKSIVEQHGGEIGLITKPGEGSTFWFEVPIASD